MTELEKRRAIFSPDRIYRYALYRNLRELRSYGEDIESRRALFIMMNPSTADEEKLDPTLTRCRNFALGWGCTDMYIANCFAYRTPYPRELRAAAKRGHDIVGPENDRWIETLTDAVLNRDLQPGLVVCAWGPGAEIDGRAHRVLEILRVNSVPAQCLGRSKSGAPRHPLMLANSAQLEPYG